MNLKPSPIELWLEGVSLIAPGINNWDEGTRLLCGEGFYQPAPTLLPSPKLLPAAESRRASHVVKLCLALGVQACQQAGQLPAELASVFCSSTPDGVTIDAICEALASVDRSVSPTRFHNSVHNAASGYWSIAVRSMLPAQVLCAFDATFSAGLMEAAVQMMCSQARVLLLAYDSKYPEPIFYTRPIPDAGGIGMVLSPCQTTHAQAHLNIVLKPDGMTKHQEGGLAIPYAPVSPPLLSEGIAALTLDNLPQQIPALHGLSLLRHVARRSAAHVALPYLCGRQLHVDIEPC